MEKIIIDASRCKGCGYCMNACPKGALTVSDTVNAKGYHPITADEEKCVSCGSCYQVCPDYVITLV